MSFLFSIQGNVVYPNPETLLISPFKEIWERDKSKGKEVAIQEFSYIEFMTSMLRSNPFREYPENRKESVIRQEVIKEENWKPDSLVKQAMEKIILYQEEGSISYSYWLSNKLAAEKIIDFFNNFDMDERNPKTFNPIYKPKDITSSIADAERTLNTLNNLKKKVDEEVYEEVRNKGNKEISVFAK